jgi:hypothetical protein
MCFGRMLYKKTAYRTKKKKNNKQTNQPTKQTTTISSTKDIIKSNVCRWKTGLDIENETYLVQFLSELMNEVTWNNTPTIAADGGQLN